MLSARRTQRTTKRTAPDTVWYIIAKWPMAMKTSHTIICNAILHFRLVETDFWPCCASDILYVFWLPLWSSTGYRICFRIFRVPGSLRLRAAKWSPHGAELFGLGGMFATTKQQSLGFPAEGCRSTNGDMVVSPGESRVASEILEITAK